jgi:hypothetical protein
MNSKVKGALVVAAIAGLLGGAVAGCSSTDSSKPAQSSCKAGGSSCKAGGASCGKSSCGK